MYTHSSWQYGYICRTKTTDSTLGLSPVWSENTDNPERSGSNWSTPPAVPVTSSTVSLTGGIIICFLCGLGISFHLTGDGADDTQLREQHHTFLALELGGAAGKVVDSTQTDLGFFGLQHHHVAISVWHRDAGLVIETSGDKINKIIKVWLGICCCCYCWNVLVLTWNIVVWRWAAQLPYLWMTAGQRCETETCSYIVMMKTGENKLTQVTLTLTLWD